MKREHASNVRKSGGSFDREVITCKNPDCDQIIATRDGWGEPLAPYRTGWTIEGRGRIAIRCETCGNRNRLTQTTRLPAESMGEADRYMQARDGQ